MERRKRSLSRSHTATIQIKKIETKSPHTRSHSRATAPVDVDALLQGGHASSSVAALPEAFPEAVPAVAPSGTRVPPLTFATETADTSKSKSTIPIPATATATGMMESGEDEDEDEDSENSDESDESDEDEDEDEDEDASSVSSSDSEPLKGPVPLDVARIKAHDEPLREGNVAELPAAFCDEWLGGGKWARIGSEGTGNCLFWSLCTSLNYKKFVHLSRVNKRAVADAFRCDLVATLSEQRMNEVQAELHRTRSKHRSKTRDSIAEELCRPREWANEATIRVAQKALGVNLLFVHARYARMYCGVHSRKTLRDALQPAAVALDPKSDHDRGTVLVWWCNRSEHFEALVRLERVYETGGDATGVAFRGMLQPSCIPEDARAVQAIMRKYVESCAAQRIDVTRM